MRDALLFLGCWLFAGIVAVAVFHRIKTRRPYLAARWDDEAGDRVNETPHDVGPDPLRLLDDITAHLKAYGAEIADYYEPARTGDHANHPTGDQT